MVISWYEMTNPMVRNDWYEISIILTNDDYNKALKGWNAFDCKTTADYQRVYCEKDVLLLTDVFKKTIEKRVLEILI